MARHRHRREFMQLGSVAMLSLTLPWAGVAAQSAILGDPDAFGVRLPAGYRARLIAASGQFVTNTRYRWHAHPDGGGTFAAKDRVLLDPSGLLAEPEERPQPRQVLRCALET